MMAHGGGVIIIVAEMATSHVAPVLSSEDFSWHHSKLFHLCPKKSEFHIASNSGY